MDFLHLFVVALSNFRQKSFNQVHDLRLWDECVGGVSGHHLSSTWRASYNSFWLVEKLYALQFQTEHGLSRSFFVQSEKYSFFRCAGASVDPDVWVSKILLRQCVSVGPYIYWNMLKYASIIFEVLLKRGWARINFGVLTRTVTPRIWGLIKPRSMSFSLGFWSWNFFFIYTQYIWLAFLECNWMYKKVPVHEL